MRLGTRDLPLQRHGAAAAAARPCRLADIRSTCRISGRPVPRAASSAASGEDSGEEMEIDPTEARMQDVSLREINGVFDWLYHLIHI